MPDAGPDGSLSGETAAYLVQHADDLVAWRPWGAEAFEVARRDGRPVFLSVGYASCHWCHLTQRESYRDPDAARFIDANLVPVLVDREQRPDVDHLYQQYVTASSGSGGWPLAVFLTPDGLPFYGGTYFPRRPSFAMQSFAAVLTGAAGAWREDRAATEAVARDAGVLLADLQAPKPPVALGREELSGIAARVVALEDRDHGGLGGAPKYPDWPVLGFLIAYGKAAGDEECLGVAERAARAIVGGGLYDHAGGGVFRYTSDDAWRVPHFEKMLSDNALLLCTLAALWEVSPSDELAHAARRTAEFMGRDLARPGGGMWGSLDAEAGGVAGAAYLWTTDELAAVLTAAEIEVARSTLGVPAEAGPGARIVLTRPAGRTGDAAATDAVLDKLLRARGTRGRPRAITNAPADANALAATGLLRAAAAFGDDGLAAQGLDVLAWLVDEAVASDGVTVAHLVGDASSGRVALLADHAALAEACVAAHAVDGGAGHDRRAAALLERCLGRFEEGGTLAMGDADPLLPTRPVAYDDVPAPSGMAMLLGVHRELRPQDGAGFRRLFGPLAAFAAHAPLSAGRALELAVAESF